MSKPDPRWEKMFAYFGEPPYNIDTGPFFFDEGCKYKYDEWWFLYIEVWYNGLIYYNQKYIQKDSLENIALPKNKLIERLFQMMVESIDDEMNKYNSRSI